MLDEVQQVNENTQTQGFESVGDEQVQPETVENQNENQQTAAQTAAEQFVSEQQYKELQGHSTRQGQQLADLSNKYNSLVEYVLSREPQQTQQTQTAQSPWDLPDQDFRSQLQNSPKEVLRSLIQSEANRLADDMLKPVKDELSATQRIINTQKVEQTLSDLKGTFGSLPNYDQVLNQAVDYLLGPGKAAANADPAGALATQFYAHVGRLMHTDPSILTKMQTQAVQQTQQQQAQKQMASPMTTSSNVTQNPHQMLQQSQQSQQVTNEQMARQISTYGEPEFQSQRPMKAMFQEI